jgi:hypothetical protein
MQQEAFRVPHTIPSLSTAIPNGCRAPKHRQVPSPSMRPTSCRQSLGLSAPRPGHDDDAHAHAHIHDLRQNVDFLAWQGDASPVQVHTVHQGIPGVASQRDLKQHQRSVVTIDFSS